MFLKQLLLHLFFLGSLNYSIDVFAGISLDDYRHMDRIEAQREYSVLIIDVVVNSLEGTEVVKEFSYTTEYEPIPGPVIKKRMKKFLASCTISLVEKNQTDLKLVPGNKIVVSFWKDLESDGQTRESDSRGKRYLKEDEQFKLMFLRSDVPMGKTVEFIPRYIYQRNEK